MNQIIVSFLLISALELWKLGFDRLRFEKIVCFSLPGNRYTPVFNAVLIASFDFFFQFSANHLDSRSVTLKNSRGNVVYKSGAAIYKETYVMGPIYGKMFKLASITPLSHTRKMWDGFCSHLYRG